VSNLLLTKASSVKLHNCLNTSLKLQPNASEIASQMIFPKNDAHKIEELNCLGLIGFPWVAIYISNKWENKFFPF